MKPILTLLLCLFMAPIWSAHASRQGSPTPAKEKDTVDENKNDTSSDANTLVPPSRLPSSTVRAQIPADTEAYIEVLGKALEGDDKKVRWLMPEDKSFLTLWQADRSGAGKGAILILHGEGEHASWPETIQPLHDTLPDYGWATLAISLPQAPKAKHPKRTLPVKTINQATSDEETKQQPDTTASQPTQDIPTNTASSPSIPPPEETGTIEPALTNTIEKRLSAALKFLHDRGQFNIVFIGNSSNAIHAHKFISRLTPKLTDPRLKRQLEKPVRAMVIVNARNRLASMQEDYSDWFNDPELMVLDITTSQRHKHYLDSKKRKVLAKQKKVGTYKNVRLPPLSAPSWGENLLSRRIRSFLDANVQGVQVDGATVNRY